MRTNEGVEDTALHILNLGKKMEVSGQHHVPAALPLGKQHPASTL